MFKMKAQIEIETRVVANRIMGELVAERKHQGKTQQENTTGDCRYDRDEGTEHC